MSHHNADVIVHIDETLDEVALLDLENEIAEDIGVISVSHNPRRPHLLMVDFDSEITHGVQLLGRVQQQGMHAQLVGF